MSKPTGYDPGTWGEAKQDLILGYFDEVDQEIVGEELYETAWNDCLAWVCDQLGIEEHEIAREK